MYVVELKKLATISLTYMQTLIFLVNLGNMVLRNFSLGLASVKNIIRIGIGLDHLSILITSVARWSRLKPILTIFMTETSTSSVHIIILYVY